MENTEEQLASNVNTENESLPDIPDVSQSESIPPDMPNADQIEIARLSSLVNNQTSEIAELNARIVACQQHYESIINRQKDDYSREKQSSVMRYAQAEKSKLDSDKRCEILTTKNNELSKERENAQMKLAEFKLMNSKLQQAYEVKLAEIVASKKEVEKLKELNQSMDATLKSTLNHLKGETTQLREQREVNERLKKELIEQRDINEQLRTQCNELTETAKATPSDDERAQAFDILLSEHNALKVKLTNIQEENNVLRGKVKVGDEDRLALENVIESFRANALREKEATKKLYDDLLAARDQDSLELSKLRQAEHSYNQTLADNTDLRQLLAKEHEHLEFTQKLTETNSILQSEHEQFETTNKQLTIELKEAQKRGDEQTRKIAELEELSKRTRESLDQLNEKYEGLVKMHDQASRKYEDSQVEIQSLKKKHQANTKDLIKQLQQLQKTKLTTNGDSLSPATATSQIRLNRSKENGGDGASSRGSPTSSCCSLNEMNTPPQPPSPDQCLLQPTPVIASGEVHQHQIPPDDEQEVIVNIVDIDRQKLIDKLLKQQKNLVRRNEKIEFLNDHIQLLTQDLQNKRKIIQSYAMNEDGFMYTSNESGLAKQQLATKSRRNSSSLMATLYNRATGATSNNSPALKLLPNMFQEQSSPMTLETALDIMGKLQAVLEDTLLKNITLKESVDTLSKEIDRLSGRTTN